jgi:hypothetical protein
MTFAAAERAYLTPPEPHECERCEDDPDMDHDDCIEAEIDAAEEAAIDRAQMRREDAILYVTTHDAHDDYLIDQEQMRREDEALNGPGPRWEP